MANDMTALGNILDFLDNYNKYNGLNVSSSFTNDHAGKV